MNYLYQMIQSFQNKSIKILLSFAIAKGSFKDILPLLSKLIFNTIDIYNAQGIYYTIKQWSYKKTYR